MPDQESDWHIVADAATFENCRKDDKFAYVVTLARALNALNFVNAVMVDTEGRDDPGAQRSRLNSYLFGSAIIYEALELVRLMNRSFRHDEMFQNGLRLLLKDSTARKIEHTHLNAARHQAVFHFDPSTFAAMITKATALTSPFISSRGKKRGSINYVYADIVAGEILVGMPSNTEEFYSILEDAMRKTKDLVVKFADEAERLIAHHLKAWGFRRE